MNGFESRLRAPSLSALIDAARGLGPNGQGLAADDSPDANPEYKRGIVNLICEATGLTQDDYPMIDKAVTE